jgi:hypothetical protein
MLGRIIVLGMCLGVGMVCADVEHKDSKQMSYAVSPGAKLVVDNVWGGIRVTAQPGREFRVTVQEHWRADTQEKLAEARREVRLAVTNDSNAVTLLVDGPFRCNCRGSGIHFDGDLGYRVRYDFDISVPVDTPVVLKTVNGGDISVKGTRGSFEVRNVNGSIDLADVATGGSVHTVNGRISVIFAENPTSALSAKTVNGEVTMEFQPNVSADLRFKTMNGEVYTDFDVSALAAEPLKIERGERKVVYRSNKFAGVRIGAAGGPEHRFETLNGNIRILKRGR